MKIIMGFEVNKPLRVYYKVILDGGTKQEAFKAFKEEQKRLAKKWEEKEKKRDEQLEMERKERDRKRLTKRFFQLIERLQRWKKW